jgi:peptide chain release factor 2
MLEDNFWQDKSKSQKIIKEKKLFEDLINSHQNSVGQINDLDDLYQLAIEENNSEIQKKLVKISLTLERLQNKMK